MTTIIRNFVRINTAIFFAALVTLLLFYVMQLMISSQGEVPKPGAGIKIGILTIPEIPLTVLTKAPKPPEPEEAVTAPTVERVPAEPGGEGYIQPELPTLKPNLPSSEGIGLSDGNALAMVQIQPTYPNRAITRGIEGYVVVEFNIDEAGSVVDPRVLISEPSGIFDKAAIKAILRWKYSPKVVNGKEVKVFGIKQKMVFSLEE